MTPGTIKAVEVKVHLWTKDSIGEEWTACRRSLEASPRGGVPSITKEPAEVTCRVCRNSVYWACHVAPMLRDQVEDLLSKAEVQEIIETFKPRPSAFLEALKEC